MADTLARWFESHARDLPWRRRRDGYSTWIAETMLQQTRVTVVEGYFERWMATFPDVATLADASEHDVLSAWEGLGYYARARRLLETARILVERHAGAVPHDERTLRSLPGIGGYAAAAIAAFAFGARTVAVDGNVRRVGARFLGDPAPSDAYLRRALDPLLPIDRPAVGTEALIELGALVCTPQRPRCGDCPLAPECTAARLGRQEEIPTRPTRAKPIQRSTFAWVVVRQDAVWMVQRRRGGLLGGLWGWPQRDAPPMGTHLDPVRHLYSHIDLTVTPVYAPDHPPPRASEDEIDGAWIAAETLATVPCSRVDRKIVDLVRRRGLLP